MEHWLTCECCGVSGPDVKKREPWTGIRCDACTPIRERKN